MTRILRLLADRRLGMLLVAAWVLDYLTAAVWSEEAFAGFVKRLETGPAAQALFVTYLLHFALLSFARLRHAVSGRHVLGVAVGILRVGLWLVLTGFLVSVTTKQMIRPLVGEGDVIGTSWTEARFPVDRIRPSLRDRVLDIDTSEGLFSMEPELIVNLNGGAVRVGAFPPTRIGRTWIHILETGLAPGLRLRQGDRIVREGYVALRLLPPGGTASFELQQTPYSFLFKLLPKKKIRKRGLEAGVYDLRRPLYDLRVLRESTEIARGPSDRPLRFDGYTVEIFDTDYWAFLDVVRDDGIPLVAGGLLLMAAGLLLTGVRGLYVAGLFLLS